MLARPDWSTLPDDAISTIASHITDDADNARFRSVCASFRSAAPHRPLLPWLLVDYRAALDDCWVDLDDNLIPFEDLPYEDYPNGEFPGDGQDRFGGFRLCRFPTADFSPTHRLPDATTAVAGCRSWLALLSDTSPGITLHNPFACVSIDLPALAYLRRFVLSSDPGTPCVVFALSGRRGLAYLRPEEAQVAYCRPGDASWTLMPGISDGILDDLDDILFYRGRLYAVHHYKLFVCDFGAGCVDVSVVLPADRLFSDGDAREWCRDWTTSYLVESSGDLLLVSTRNGPTECDWTIFMLEVFRVDLDDGRFTLTRLDDLGGRSLFLSLRSMSVSASIMPCCKGDCIYFIPDIELYEFGVRVFSLTDGSVTEFPGLSDDKFRNWDMLWLTPSLC